VVTVTDDHDRGCDRVTGRRDGAEFHSLIKGVASATSMPSSYASESAVRDGVPHW
jgi:hypothetical protein